MTDPLASLEPRALWSHFASIAAIPRPSKHEERIIAWVRSLAAERAFDVQSDGVGNLVLRVPATAGREHAPPVILQGHLDMVCEKNKDSSHDFMSDPIRTRVDGEWVRAAGTTLGADNGIGVAAALAAATDPSVKHGPLELLFTVDEETGLTGAQGLDGSMLEGRTLLNLDSEEDGKIYVGCAGGADTHLFLDVEHGAARTGLRAHRLEVTGLSGGHSGLNIHENRGNALKLLARLLTSALEDSIELDLGGLLGGSMHNAIPREAEATIHVRPGDEERLRGLLSRMEESFRVELQRVDPGLRLRFTPADDAPGEVLSPRDRDALLHLLMVLPHGVLAMSPDLAGLVETSSNVASISNRDGKLRIVTSTRSSLEPSKQAVLGSIRSAGALAGARVETHDGYPGWKPNLDSKVLAVVRDAYRRIWDGEPEVTAIHAGLECGLLGEKVPDLDMVSFGPQIEGAHSPDERIHIPSVARFWTALTRILDTLSA